MRPWPRGIFDNAVGSLIATAVLAVVAGAVGTATALSTKDILFLSVGVFAVGLLVLTLIAVRSGIREGKREDAMAIQFRSIVEPLRKRTDDLGSKITKLDEKIDSKIADLISQQQHFRAEMLARLLTPAMPSHEGNAAPANVQVTKAHEFLAQGEALIHKAALEGPGGESTHALIIWNTNALIYVRELDPEAADIDAAMPIAQARKLVQAIRRLQQPNAL